MNENTNKHYQHLSKTRCTVWKVIYALTFGWLGYTIMDMMQNDRASKVEMANAIIDLQEKQKELDGE